MSPNIRGKCTEDADRYNKYNPLLVQIPREGNNTCSLYSVGGIFDKTRAHTLSPSFLLSPRRGRSFLYTVAPCSDLSRHPRCLPHPSKRNCPINHRRISKRNPKSKRLRARQTLAMLLLPKGDVVVLREARTRSQGERPLPQQQQRLVLRGNAADLRRRRRRMLLLLMANRPSNASAVVRPRQSQKQHPTQSQNLHLMLLENQVQRKSGVGHRRRPEILTFSVSVSLLCVIFAALVRICTCQIYRFPALSFTT